MTIDIEEPVSRVDLSSVFEDIVRQRRSVYFYLDQDVPRHLLERALQMAVLAPSHYHTRPWRFTVFRGSARAELATAYEKAAVRIGWHPGRARCRAFDAPVMVVIGCVPDVSHPRVRPLEEEFATAAATQNLMLALTSMQLSCAMSSSPLQLSDEVEQAAGIEGGRVVGVLQVGYRDSERELFKRPQPGTAGVVRWR
ncbi:nitroreductase family protein [Variovorax sp. RA8]|uniref:nitroreductase family protein n=1 Tax=Variovorax sp. (strain JCM 16519 / RA8) TaxID=662548 RepID=UPI000AAF289E|nr:nitroreductase family protein [Variovorax sp. RA8]VTU13602.1 Putative NAD(P)H nitroreductase YdjA [Variovorax sp. RA8]